MNIKKALQVMILGGATLSAAAPVAAATYWNFQDDNIDFLLRPDTNGDLQLVNPTTCAGADCNIVVGDTLAAAFTFQTFSIDGVNAIPTGKQITGVAGIQYLGNVISPLDGVSTVRNYGPVTGGLNSILAFGGTAGVIGGAAGEGAMIAMYVGNGGLDLSTSTGVNCTSLSDCIGAASTGSLLQVDGNPGIGSNFWVSGLGGANIKTVLGQSSQLQVAVANFALDTIFNTVEPVCFQDILSGDVSATCGAYLPGYAQLVGSSISGGGKTGGISLSNGAFSYGTTITMGKYVNVPEPGTIALMGLGLLVAGRVQKKRA